MAMLTNCQLIMCDELKIKIEQMRTAGTKLPDIIKTITGEYKDSYWCVADVREREEVINVCLYAYAMTPAQQEAYMALRNLVGTVMRLT